MFIPQSTIGLPSQAANGATVNSSVIPTGGQNSGSVGLASDHAGTLSVQRYVDAAGTIAIGAAITDNTAPYALSWTDGIPTGSIKVSFINSSGAVANLTNVTVLLSP